MPCLGGGPSAEQVREEAMLPAALCAILSTLEKRGLFEDILHEVDWSEAGVSEHELRAWWGKHKQRDAERRVREDAQRKREDERQAAIDALTPEQKRALGL